MAKDDAHSLPKPAPSLTKDGPRLLSRARDTRATMNCTKESPVVVFRLRVNEFTGDGHAYVREGLYL